LAAACYRVQWGHVGLILGYVQHMIPVEIVEEKPFVNIGSGYEFNRFFKYWNKAKNTAFLPNANIENE
jgi:hypothetical protein